MDMSRRPLELVHSMPSALGWRVVSRVQDLRRLCGAGFGRRYLVRLAASQRQGVNTKEAVGHTRQRQDCDVHRVAVLACCLECSY
jgi:hypothetical protein